MNASHVSSRVWLLGALVIYVKRYNESGLLAVGTAYTKEKIPLFSRPVGSTLKTLNEQTRSAGQQLSQVNNWNNSRFFYEQEGEFIKTEGDNNRHSA
jgi:hypothetical protein